MAILIIIIIITIFTEPSNIITDLCVKAQDEVNAVKFTMIIHFLEACVTSAYCHGTSVTAIFPVTHRSVIMLKTARQTPKHWRQIPYICQNLLCDWLFYLGYFKNPAH